MKPLDLKAIQERLESAQGKTYWRSLEELAETEGFQEFLHREFPNQASEWTDPVSRRHFLTLMGASLGLAGLSGCKPGPPDKIVPYVRQPEEVVPGKPLLYATAMTLGGYATGLLAESHLGRPTKIEGNPDHPASLGATDAFAQASVLTLYDPDRSQGVTFEGRPSTWAKAFQAIRKAVEQQRPKQGAGIAILTETITSPTLGHQLDDLMKLFPEAQWYQYEPAGRDTILEGAKLAFGEYVNTIYKVDHADVILALDADFLSSGPGHLRYARDYAASRRVLQGQPASMNRLYAVESMPTNTGMTADHHLPLQAWKMEAFAAALAGDLARALRAGGFEKEIEPTVLARLNAQKGLEAVADHAKWIAAVVRDLTKKEHCGKTLIIPGEQQTALVHALAHVMNHALGNVARTVVYSQPVEVRPENQHESLKRLVQRMADGKVDLLLILGANPVYTAPADVDFVKALERVPLRVHLGLYKDETSAYCHWHIPETHYLESWSDARCYDGTATIIQPLIAPLYSGSKSVHELLVTLSANPERSGHDLVKEHWRDHWKSDASSGEFEQFWRKAVHDGVVPDTALPTKKVTLTTDPSSWPAPRIAPPDGDSLEIVFRPDPTIYDGRFANNGWLQELPKPLTKLTWDNASMVGPAMAERLGLHVRIGWRGGEHGEAHVDVIKLRLPNREVVEAPIWILPGHPDDSITVHLGYGRTRAGRVGNGAGFNAYKLRSSGSLWFETGLTIAKTGKQYLLASTQQHYSMEGRHLVRAGTLEQYRRNPHFAAEMDHAHAGEPSGKRPLSMYPPVEYSGYKWGMVIDLSACIGCGACVVACQAENNIPVVGKSEVLRGRAMHWLRIDRYFEGNLKNPTAYHQPVPCMQCENAPCEVVCPTLATNHSDEGLNDMVYNRCVGTRYCSNNCPYKVRRFNFLQYADYATESLKLQRNPEVTVRSRGVMEKCTYCVQRISAARIEAEKEDRRIQDGEVVTACQTACPAQAIVFGDLNDETSRVKKLHDEPLDYALLGELNTRPRTTYLAALRNPNPDPDLRAV